MTNRTAPTTLTPISTFGWLDHREEDARRVREVVNAFGDKSTVDPLGLGTVRDAIAEELFPGTSTLMTRARYLLFVPWVMQHLETQRVPSKRAAEEARRLEVQLIEALVSGDPDREGIIGINARARVKLLPSTAYWTALGRWGIRTVAGSRDQYLQGLDALYRRRREALHTDDGEILAPGLTTWLGGLPDAPEDWLDSSTMDLTAEEARFLRERILNTTPGHLLRELVLHPADHLDRDFVWDTQIAGDLDDDLGRSLLHARAFSQLMVGAQLVYNLQLDELRESDGADADVDGLRDDLDVWEQELRAYGPKLSEWSPDDFWQWARVLNPRIPHHTEQFVRWWCEHALARPDELAENPEVREVITNREVRMKRRLARLENRRARETTDGYPGRDQLNFRWSQVRVVIRDLARGLEETD